MPLEGVCVNLWKSSEVSYLQLDSYSTGWVAADCASRWATRQNGTFGYAGDD